MLLERSLAVHTGLHIVSVILYLDGALVDGELVPHPARGFRQNVLRHSFPV